MVHRVTADMKTVHTRVVMVIFSPSFPKADMQLLLKGMCVWVPAAHCSKANKQARLVERKVWFISGAGNCGGRVADICPKADSPRFTCPDKQGVGGGGSDSINRVRDQGLHAETAQSSLTVVFKLVISGLTSIILIVLGTVSLQFQSPFVPISLQSVLGTVAAHVLGTLCSACS